LVSEAKSLHNHPGYYPDTGSDLFSSLSTATPSASLPPQSDFIAAVEGDWRVRFSNKLNACPFKPGTGSVFLDDHGNRLDGTLRHLQDMLKNLDEHVDFERCV
jgi:hypothetical protein